MLVGCGGAPLAPGIAPHDAVPSVRFAIANGKTVRIIRTTDVGLVIERAVEAPDTVGRIFWLGPDPTVWLDVGDLRWPNMRNPDAEPTGHEGEMGVIAATGYAKLPPIAWPATPKPTEDESYGMASEVSWDQLYSTVDDQLIERHCSWFGGPDGGWCMRWTYYRRFPLPAAFTTEGKEGGGWQLPAIARPATIRAAIVDRAPAEADPEADADAYHPEPKKTLRCTIGARVVDWPEPDEYDTPVTIGDPIWLSTDPPVFASEQNTWSGVGPASDPDPTVFEGCDPSKRYKRVAGGPHGLVAIFGAQLSVRWHGKDVGTSPVGGTRVAFEPSP